MIKVERKGTSPPENKDTHESIEWRNVNKKQNSGSSRGSDTMRSSPAWTQLLCVQILNYPMLAEFNENLGTDKLEIFVELMLLSEPFPFNDPHQAVTDCFYMYFTPRSRFFRFALKWLMEIWDSLYSSLCIMTFAMNLGLICCTMLAVLIPIRLPPPFASSSNSEQT